jgi:hypothetical protein
MSRTRILLGVSLLLAFASRLPAETIFLEAETFTPSSDGWRVCRNFQTARASRTATLHGDAGDPRGTASHAVNLRQAGRYRIWVRYQQVAAWRGAFRLAAVIGDREIAGQDFDVAPDAGTPDWHYLWKSFDADLPAGTITLRLSKYKNEPCSAYVRHVDCILLTTDKDLVPDHVPYGPQTYVRVTLGDVYARPAYIHIFADHFRDPWYSHHFLARNGCQDRLQPSARDLLRGGERTPWCNISRLVYQDSGALLNVSARYSYQEKAPRLLATFEFATAPEDGAVVRKFRADCTPGGMVVVMPPDLTTPENRARFGRDKDYADRTGQHADEFSWPSAGRKPRLFPFLVQAQLGGYDLAVDDQVRQREEKTLAYFGFSNNRRAIIGGGTWLMKNGSYCRPDVQAIRRAASDAAARFKKSGKDVRDIAFFMLMDEPAGQEDRFLARDPAGVADFRAWLKELGKTPAELGVADAQAVRPVTRKDRDRLPALYYYTQRFRTRALGRFMALQRQAVQKAFGASFPVGANFSDGATYFANFYGQGVDYFDLLDGMDQNAIWGEDWANLSSTYQCAAYNVDLMRGAAGKHGQTIGHYHIAHARRKGWDIKLRAASEVARGVRVFQNYFYGASWGTHEGGPTWRSSSWDMHPEVWRAIAETVREIGGAEELLMPARPRRADVAILYSSSADIWTAGVNHAHGFDRMHTWLALAHAQVPVDFLSEKHVEEAALDGYKVCYLFGPNLARAAASRLREWVTRGGTLWLSAEAGTRDEWNRALTALEEIAPATRQAPVRTQPWLYAGRFLYQLSPLDVVKAGNAAVEVLSVKQELKPRPGAQVLAAFKDGTPALVRGQVGQGSVYCAGFLPGLAYIKSAQVARRELGRQRRERLRSGRDADLPEVTLLDRSDNPWQFPAAVRDFLLQPVRAASVRPPLACSVPLVDAVLLEGERGNVVPLANYTLRPLAEVRLTVRTAQPVRRVSSIYQGDLYFDQPAGGPVSFVLPLECTDYVQLYYR